MEERDVAGAVEGSLYMSRKDSRVPTAGEGRADGRVTARWWVSSRRVQDS